VRRRATATRTIQLLSWALLAGCASAPPGTPEEVAPRIVALLDEQEIDEADELFDAAEATSDELYPLLYESARGRHERGEAHGSAAILRFMSRQYPGSRAVREALLYALFAERAGVAQPSTALVQEIGAVLASLQADAGSETQPWVFVVRAQHAIDRGDLRGAREAFARFQAPAEKSPPELTVYIEDIERYLATHP
jgi:hypothetical protein